MKRIRPLLFIFLGLLTGVIIGGYLFSDTRPRSVLALNRCGGTCLQANEFVGLLASVGIQKLPALLPSVIRETDRTIVIEHPSPQARVHYLIIPKRDIKNVGEVSEDDREYLMDVFRVTGDIVNEKQLVNYRLITNGPGYQGVTYLHFHLTAF